MNGFDVIKDLVSKIEKVLAEKGVAHVSIPKLLELMDRFYIFPEKFYSREIRPLLLGAWCHGNHMQIDRDVLIIFRGDVNALALKETVECMYQDLDDELNRLIALARLDRQEYFTPDLKEEPWLEKALDNLMILSLAIEHERGWVLSEEGEVFINTILANCTEQ